ncbi:E3 ubiquitin-protein ligase TRAIP-like isoform X2 [Condylostylus longicornis]|uniref:E3 ubiquitin-protein ligase TRAIP-like isoform X2 n=1 Tax=Condylostylus longicornis TaxID=2530218 RepID=UPI00244E0B93|nr:E3 ubiquitin-protein ligase TRAIP-like isoform X2 [Condylostylus longicornis]
MEISCAICDDKFNTTCHIGATLCGHVFHYECFSKWEERSNTCPQCRLVVETNDMRRLYLNINQEKEYHLAENCVAEDFAKELDFVLEQNNLLKSEFKVGEENLEKLMCEKLSLRDEIETLKANVEETNIKYTNLKRNLKKYKKETTKNQ